jgi:hypothetical protein
MGVRTQGMQHYDGEAHVGAFALPRPVRLALKDAGGDKR